MKEFLYVARYQMAVPGSPEGVAGGVIVPSNLSSHMLVRRDLSKKYPTLRRRLLDPQLYLAALQPKSVRQNGINLSSYPWFPVAAPTPYDSGEQTHADWKACLRDDAILQDDLVGTSNLRVVLVRVRPAA